MSLVVWLPLNGNLENQGLSNVTVTNNGATVDDNGKIGKCYRFDGDVYLNLSKGIDTTKDYSICYWFKEFANNTLSQFRVVYQCGSLVVGQYGSALDIYNNAGGFDVMATIDTTAWHHACFTFQSSENLVTIYIDGKYASNKTVTSIPTSNSYAIIGKRSDGTYLFQGNLNDFRIYDHALSAKEVGELAKGLVLHYRLAGPGQENLITSLSAGGQTSLDGTYSVHTSKTNADTYFYANLSSSLNPGDKVTVSCDVSGFSSNNYQWNFPFWSQGSGLAFWLKNGHCSQTFTVPSGATASNRIIFDDNGTINGFTRGDSIIYIKNFKVERGSVPTPWCPHSSDTLYSTLGYNNNIEYDCSGYRRNGAKSGTITWDIDSPRYTTSYKMGGTGTSIVGPSDLSHLNTFTYSCWFNRKTTENAFLIMGYQYGNNSSGSLAISENGLAGFHCYRFSTGDAETHIAGNINYNDGKWHMLTVTYENNIIKVYVDGIKTAEKNNISLLTSNRTFVINYPSGSINNNEYRDYKGLLSDARVYATALSAEDIAELYHSAVIVDNTGKNYAYEYFEV